MILNPTSRRPTPNPDPSVSWSALCPHGVWVTWSQVMFEVPPPGCETAACSGVSSGGSGKIRGPRLDEGAGRVLVTPARPTPCQPSSQSKEQ